MEICNRCGIEISPENTTCHLVRKGYSLEHFPALKYEKLLLCPECRQRQKKVDIAEKVVAILTLGIVLFLLVIGILLLFSRVGER